MKWHKFVVGFDPHGSLQDEKANNAFFKFIKDWRPDIRVAGGDVFDFAQLRGKASQSDKADSMEQDFELGRQWLKRLRPHYFLRGNHDERLWDLSKNAAEGFVRDAATAGTREIEKLCKSLDCEILPYDKRHGVLRLGHLKIIHGFHHGVYAARKAAMTYGSVLMGHAHSIQCSSIEGLETRMGRICGCLCKLDPDYCRHQPGTLAWEHGWAYGVVNADGLYHVWQAQRIGETWNYELA